MFKILNTALSRKLSINDCSGRLIAKKNGLCYFEIEKENKVLKLKCPEGVFNKHFKTNSTINTHEQKIIDTDYNDLMKFYS